MTGIPVQHVFAPQKGRKEQPSSAQPCLTEARQGVTRGSGPLVNQYAGSDAVGGVSNVVPYRVGAALNVAVLHWPPV